MSSSIRNQVKLAGVGLAAAVALTMSPDMAFAQSGHFIENGAGAPTCIDTGTTLQCTGKVAGLAGETFTIVSSASGTATVACTNPGGNVSPGQATSVTASGSVSGLTPQNGQFVYTLTTATPTVPNFPTCPNPGWTATVTDVAFGDATLTLLEDGAVSDQITVPVQ